MRDPNPPIHEKVPPEMRIEAKRIEIYRCLMAGKRPKVTPRAPPERAPHLNPYFMISHFIETDYRVLCIEIHDKLMSLFKGMLLYSI